MATRQLPRWRQESDVLIHLKLKDNGVAVDWTSLADISAYMYSDTQRIIMGRAEARINGSDSEVLDVSYFAVRPQYLGPASIVVRCTYQGRVKTYDLPVGIFVPRTAMATGIEVITDPEIDAEIDIDDIEAPESDVTLEVEEVSTSLLDGAIEAANEAADRANEAAERAEHVSGEAVLYVEQELSSGQQSQARTNIGAGTYTKPLGGIPSQDLSLEVNKSLMNKVTSSKSQIPDNFTTSDITEVFDKFGIDIEDFLRLSLGTSNFIIFKDPYTISHTWLYSVSLRDNKMVFSDGIEQYILTLSSNPEFYTFAKHETELTSNKVTALSAQSTDTQYPSAKLVYDQLATKQPTIDSLHKLSYSLISDTPDLSGFITKSVNDLTNYYLKSETYTRAEVEALIAAIQGMEWVPVDTLPTASASTMNKIYLVPAANPQTQNQLDEYYTKDNGSEADPRYTWELFGSAAIDLSGKADKVSGATSGNFAGLDANGNLVDSGKKASDFATAAQGTKADGAVRFNASQSLTDAQKLQARNNIEAAKDDVLVVNTTDTSMTYDIVNAAYIAGKLVIAVYNGLRYTAVGKRSNGNILFTCLDVTVSTSGREYSTQGLELNTDDLWIVNVNLGSIENAANKVTSFGSTPSDTKYPSEKLVKDSLDAKQPTIDAQHKLDYSLVDNTPTMPTVPDISTNIATDASSDDKTASPKAVKTYVDNIVGNIETLLAAI